MPRPRSKRRINDNYPTPDPVAQVGWRLAQRYLAMVGVDRVRVCEPGCGDGQPFLRAAAADPRVTELWGGDLRDVAMFDAGAWAPEQATCCVVQRKDWMGATTEAYGPWDVIITNPPFVDAEHFARCALARTTARGVVVMLVRLSFLATQRRRAFWAEHPPSEVAVLRPRPSFTGDGNTDGTEYAFVVWCPSAGQAPMLTWVDWRG